MTFFWTALAVGIVIVLVLGWRHDRRARARGRGERGSAGMVSETRELRRDARVAVDQAAWSRTAADYTSEQLNERASRRDRRGHE